jgi:Tfp pilus assembly protein PilP
MKKGKGQRTKNKLLPVAAPFLFFWAMQPGITFSGTDSGNGIEVEFSEDVSKHDSNENTIHGKFNLSGLKDPFKSFLLDLDALGGEKSRERRTYLETVDLSQLELIAVIVSPDDGWAMLRDSKGIGYVVRPGTPVGTGGGKVYRIRPGEIILRSVQRNAGGGIMVRETTKRLVQ